MRACFVLVMVVLLPAVVINAWASEEPASLGQQAGTIVSPPDQRFGRWELVYNHNGTFENGYSWTGSAIAPPYYGAFAESFDLGAVAIHSAVFWLTQTGYYQYPDIDFYIWEGGISGEPGIVLYMRTGYHFDPPAVWPQISQHEIAVTAVAGLGVAGEFSIGFRADQAVTPAQVYIAADEDNPDGHPWTSVAPGIGYPSGWQHPGAVWGIMTLSLGIGVTFERGFSWVEDTQPLPGDEQEATWGQIKGLYRH